MEAVGRVVDQYDTDHVYDLYTFGGRMLQARNGTGPLAMTPPPCGRGFGSVSRCTRVF